MQITRQEAMNLSDVALVIAWDGLCGRLRKHWMRGQRGSLSDVYSLAVIETEAAIRCLPLKPYSMFEQLTLFTGSRFADDPTSDE